MPSSIPVSDSAYASIVLTLLLGPLGVRIAMLSAHRLLPYLFPAIRRLPAGKKDKVVIISVKILLYIATCFALLPITVSIAMTLARDGFQASLAVAGGGAYARLVIIMPLYVYELCAAESIKINTLVHHAATLLQYGLLLSGVAPRGERDVNYVRTSQVVGTNVMMFTFVLFTGILASILMPPGRPKAYVLVFVAVEHFARTILLIILGIVGLSANGRRLSAGAVLMCALTTLLLAVANVLLCKTTWEYARKAFREFREQDEKAEHSSSVCSIPTKTSNEDGTV